VLEIKIPDNLRGELTGNVPYFISPLHPFKVQEVTPHSPAALAGILPGDFITSVNGHLTKSFIDVRAELNTADSLQVALGITRTENGTEQFLTKTVILPSDKRLGVSPGQAVQYTTRITTLGEALSSGTGYIVLYPVRNVKAFFNVMAGRVNTPEELGEPVRVTSVKGILWTLAGLSFILWIYHLLPLPFSLFWEMIPLLYEGITRKLYSYKAFKRTMVFSWLLLLTLFISQFVLDILRLFN
jgi:regulator of sigma E protease